MSPYQTLCGHQRRVGDGTDRQGQDDFYDVVVIGIYWPIAPAFFVGGIKPAAISLNKAVTTEYAENRRGKTNNREKIASAF